QSLIGGRAPEWAERSGSGSWSGQPERDEITSTLGHAIPKASVAASVCLPMISRRTPEARRPRQTRARAAPAEDDNAVLLRLVEMVDRIAEPLLRVHSLHRRQRVIHPLFPSLLLQSAQQQFLVCGGAREVLDGHAGERERAQLCVIKRGDRFSLSSP